MRTRVPCPVCRAPIMPRALKCPACKSWVDSGARLHMARGTRKREDESPSARLDRRLELAETLQRSSGDAAARTLMHLMPLLFTVLYVVIRFS